MRGRFAVVFVLALAVILGGARSTFAQAAGVAQMNGTVTDPSGASVAGASITLRNTATNATYSAVTNGNGFYAIASLPPGSYELKASFAGFANYTQTGIALTVAEAATFNVGLQLAAQGEKVVVTTQVPTIEPTKTEVSQVVGSQQVESLPTSSRVFTDFALLTPGVSLSRTSLGTTFTEFEVTQISFGGMRSFSNEITVDGADFINSASGIQRSTPPQDSVQEFRVVNNSFGTEYGRTIGGIVNIVTKSGTNDMHGAAYEYFQNNAMDARSLLQPVANPTTGVPALPYELRQNIFGGELGGPIQKDKTFFYVNYEGKRSAQSPAYPPDLINNVLAIDQGKAMMGLAPEGCSAGLAKCLPNFAGNPNNITQAQAFGFLNGFMKTGDDDSGFVRLDHNFNQSNQLAIRYNVEDTRALGELVGNTLDGGGVGVPSGGRDLFVRDQSVVATLNTEITPNVVNTLLGQFARRHYNFLGMTGQPDFSILNDLEVGHNFGTNDRLYETRGELSDSVSWVKGDHIARFGVDGNLLSSLENFPGFTPTRMLIPGVSCFENFAKFFNTGYGANEAVPGGVNSLAGQCGLPPADNGMVFMYAGVPLPTSGAACIPTASSFGCTPTVTSRNPLPGGGFLGNSAWPNAYPPQFFNYYSRVIDHGYWGAYAQDQWRITSKLTLNYGIRWDVESGLGSFVTQDWNEWQPRIGLAYSPDGNTVFRAGYGIFFDRQNLTFFFVPNTQKIVAGYQCGNHATPFTSGVCSGAGIQAQQFPNIQSNLGQATQGYQIFGFPASQGAAQKAAGVIQTGGYDSFTNTGGPTGSIAMAGTCFTTRACGVGEGGMDHNSPAPYAEQASAEIDHQFGSGFALDVAYLFVGAHGLVRGNNINVPCPVGTSWSAATLAANGGPTDPLPEWSQGWMLKNGNDTPASCNSGTPTLGTGALAGLGPFFGGVFGSGLQTLSGGLEDYNNNVADATYNGLTITAIERLGKYFNLTANYTYSHTIDNGNFTTFINLPVNQFNYAAEEANSNQDLRHRLVTNFVANTPTHGWYRNFTFSSIITLQSGSPFTIYYGANTLNDVSGGATDRVGGAAVKGTHCVDTSTCQTMIPRNTYVGDPMYDWDLHLGRFFQFTRNLRLDLGFDAFNVLNRPNVQEINPVYGSPVFCGAIPTHYNDGISRAIQGGPATAPACPPGQIPVSGGSLGLTPVPSGPGSAIFIPNNPNPAFGMPRVMFNPRQLQVSARLQF